MNNNKERIVWNYKGLVCAINPTSSGYVYTVYDVGAVTLKESLILYKGKKEEIKKEEVEQAVDLYFEKTKQKPVSTCRHYLEAVCKGRCFFGETCCADNTCLFHIGHHDSIISELEEEIEELERKVSNLEDKLEEAEEDYYGDC